MSKTTNTELSPSLSAYTARPKGTQTVPGMVVLMEAFGIKQHIRDVCERLAEAGYLAVAPDIYHGETFAYDDMDRVLAKVRSLDDGTVMDETGVALDWIAQQPQVRADRVGVIGFCMGGRFAFLAAIRHAGRIAASVSFYGGGIAPEGEDRFGRTPPIGEAAKLQAPLFLGYGTEDASIAASEHGRVARTLSELEKRYTLAVYPGAGHGFLCEERASYAPAAAARAWREALAFLDVELHD